MQFPKRQHPLTHRIVAMFATANMEPAAGIACDFRKTSGPIGCAIGAWALAEGAPRVTTSGGTEYISTGESARHLSEKLNRSMNFFYGVVRGFDSVYGTWKSTDPSRHDLASVRDDVIVRVIANRDWDDDYREGTWLGADVAVALAKKEQTGEARA